MGKVKGISLSSNLKLQVCSNDDEKIPEDELPYGHPDRPFKKELDFNNINLNDPEALKKVANFNKNILLFVTVNGNPSRYKKQTKRPEIKFYSMFNKKLCN